MDHAASILVQRRPHPCVRDGRRSYKHKLPDSERIMVFPAQGLERACRVEVRSNAEAALPPPDGNDEIALVHKLKAGDESAFSALVIRHETAMLRLAMAHVRTRACAEDVVQETWLAVIRGLSRFRGQSTFKTWIFRILLNRARTAGRREARVVPFSDLGHCTRSASSAASVDQHFTRAGMIDVSRTDTAPLRKVLDAEMRERIESAIDRLPRRQRMVLTMRDVEGWPASDVCNVLQISEQNQRVLLHRARSRVRRDLEDYAAEHGLRGRNADRLAPGGMSPACNESTVRETVL